MARGSGAAGKWRREVAPGRGAGAWRRGVAATPPAAPARPAAPHPALPRPTPPAAPHPARRPAPPRTQVRRDTDGGGVVPHACPERRLAEGFASPLARGHARPRGGTPVRRRRLAPGTAEFPLVPPPSVNRSTSRPPRRAAASRGLCPLYRPGECYGVSAGEADPAGIRGGFEIGRNRPIPSRARGSPGNSGQLKLTEVARISIPCAPPMEGNSGCCGPRHPSGCPGPGAGERPLHATEAQGQGAARAAAALGHGTGPRHKAKARHERPRHAAMARGRGTRPEARHERPRHAAMARGRGTRPEARHERPRHAAMARGQRVGSKAPDELLRHAAEASSQRVWPKTRHERPRHAAHTSGPWHAAQTSGQRVWPKARHERLRTRP